MSDADQSIHPDKYVDLEQAYLSGRIEPGDFQRLLDGNPDFDRWYTARARQRVGD